MLRIVPNVSSAGASSYFSTADYYKEGQELAGRWCGKGAALLGLSGPIDQRDWDLLCDNRDPRSGNTLTARHKSERRVGYDCNFHAPKSLSLLYGLTGDERLLELLRSCVNETMAEMEEHMQTRVRKGGKNEDRTTGNLCWGEYIHLTSRPVDGIPDPHLHAHCFAFNSTWDAVENKWKAGQFGSLKQHAPYYAAVFQSKLASGMMELGLPVVRTKTGWELEGLSKATLDKFSRRTAQIEKLAKEKGITDPAEKSQLGAKTREKKQKQLGMGDLRREWMLRLSGDEQDTILRMAERIGSQPVHHSPAAAKEAAEHAILHCFEPNSVVPERTLLLEALRHSYGKATRSAVEKATLDQNVIRARHKGEQLIATTSMLEEERRMLSFARLGRGTCPPLKSDPHEFANPRLTSDQRRAVLHVLHSPDRVIILRGAAGVGKTTAMREAVDAIEAGGKKVFAFAPSTDAAHGVLRDQDGFANADTVAKLLSTPSLQQQIQGRVLWIDEAGLVGVKTMTRLFDLAEKTNARVILAGDRHQHGPIEYGAALRLLETEAGLVPAEIRQIVRQKGAYRQAVEALSERRIADGFRQLDQLGWIREVPDEERYKVLAADYVEAVQAGKSALVISPTHHEKDQITEEIRGHLRELGRLGTEQRRFTVLEKKNFTLAERKDSLNYSPGDVLVFQQNALGFKRGQRIIVGDSPLPLGEAERFQVYRTNTLPLSDNDMIRITANGSTQDGHRLNNGATFKVAGFTDRGDIRLKNGWVVGKDFGHLSHGYAITSHASQGKTVDRVFIGQSSMSAPAASREQFYVSASRAKQQMTVYTDDKRALREAIEQTDERLSATELAASRDRALAAQRIRNELDRKREPVRELTYDR